MLGKTYLASPFQSALQPGDLVRGADSPVVIEFRRIVEAFAESLDELAGKGDDVLEVVANGLYRCRAIVVSGAGRAVEGLDDDVGERGSLGIRYALRAISVLQAGRGSVGNTLCSHGFGDLAGQIRRADHEICHGPQNSIDIVS